MVVDAMCDVDKPTASSQPSGSEAQAPSSIPKQQMGDRDAKLDEVVDLLHTLASDFYRERSAQQEERDESQLQMQSQQSELRQVVESLVTQVNDISRTLTEATRSQSRWM